MNTLFWTEKNSTHWLALAVSIVPLLSLMLCLVLLAGQGESASHESGAPASGGGGIGILVVLIFLAAKALAVIGTFYRWYFGWIFHAIEMILVLFVLGLLAVIATFTQSFDLAGFSRILLIFFALAANLYFRRLWLLRSNKDLYRVSFYTHS